MPRRILLIGVVIVVALAIVAAVVVPPRLAHPAPIETKAIGAWQETGSRQAYKLTIRRDLAATGRIWYTVTYPRSFKVPFSASLDGRKIVIWGENAMSDPVWDVTYDAKSDTLTVTRPINGEHFTLRRLSD